MRRNGKMIGLVVGAMLLVLLVGGFWLQVEIQRYLRSEGFRQLVSTEVSEVLGVEGEFAPLRWSGSEIYSDRISGAGGGFGILERIEASGLRTKVLWRSIWQGSWELESLEIQQAELIFREHGGQQQRDEVTATQASTPRPWWMAFLPDNFKIREVVCQSTKLVWGDSVLDGARLSVRPDGAAWVVEANGGTLQHPLFPENRVQLIRARITHDALYLTESRIEFAEGGQMQASGEADWRKSISRFRIEFGGVSAEKIGPEGLRAHLSGVTSGTLTVDQEQGARVIQGDLRVEDGVLQGLPVQEVLARFTRAPQFNRLPLQELSVNLKISAKGTELSSLVMESRGLVRLEGAVAIGPRTEADPELRGELQMGLTSQSLRWLPGSQERVFVQSRAGYSWAELEVTGTLHHPKEDLSRRLAVAMGEEVLAAPGQVLQEGGVRAVEGGVEILSDGGDLLRFGAETAAEGGKSAIDLLSPLLPGKK
jgi:hypothetical protein